MKMQKTVGAAVASLVLAAGLLAAGAPAANAVAGTCSTPARALGASPGYVEAKCKNRVRIQWKCALDIWGTVNTRTYNYSAYTYIKFLACDESFATDVTWSGY